MRDAKTWAEGQFGHAALGDVRRTRRLVELAADVARRPSGLVSRACLTGALREGAFRLLEGGGVRPDAVKDAVVAKTVADARGLQTVIVPVDGSSLGIADKTGAKGLGGVGSWEKGGRGIQVMSALALDSSGTPLGICAQEMWVREKRSASRRKHRTHREGEGRFWLETMQSVSCSFANTEVRPWFQLDRGGDCWSVLQLATELDAWATVRATHDRRLETEGHLWSTLERATVRARRKIRVPGRPPARRKKLVNRKRITYLTALRKPRLAEVVIRTATVGLLCCVSDKRRVVIPIHAVLVREVGGPAGDRLEWMLLTTHPIRTKANVLAIVDSYALRWRIEDFHATWKRGLCRVEDTQLRSRDAIFKWATILAAVATRAMRLTHLARDTPDALATTEFSVYELRAVLAQRQPKGFDENSIPTLSLSQAVRWIADTAGYNGPWKGPPGVRIIGRGLVDILAIARALEYLDKKR